MRYLSSCKCHGQTVQLLHWRLMGCFPWLVMQTKSYILRNSLYFIMPVSALVLCYYHLNVISCLQLSYTYVGNEEIGSFLALGDVVYIQS